MPLARLERDCTGREASEFVAALAARLIEAVDWSGVFDDMQVTTADDLREILTRYFEQLAQREDEEILEWVI